MPTVQNVGNVSEEQAAQMPGPGERADTPGHPSQGASAESVHSKKADSTSLYDPDHPEKYEPDNVAQSSASALPESAMVYAYVYRFQAWIHPYQRCD